jgi:hypothetical protein
MEQGKHCDRMSARGEASQANDNRAMCKPVNGRSTGWLRGKQEKEKEEGGEIEPNSLALRQA